MTRAIAIVAGAALILLYATVMIVIMPIVQSRASDYQPEGLSAYTPAQQRGRDEYVALGCMYCHSQQPRDPAQAPDGLRGWGRPSVPADYRFDDPHLLGTMRTGPDLFNIGARQPSADWHLAHLYQPRALVPGSTMAAYPFLFEIVETLVDEDREVNVPGIKFGLGQHLIAKQEALDLVEYLLALDHTYPVDEIPKVESADAQGDDR